MRIATHNGNFHTDDVFAIALLRDLHPEAEIIRTRDEAKLDEADIVVDVGKVFDAEKKRFDHHQRQAGTRPNGIIYSGFGLIWQHYGLEFCEGNEEVWRRIDEKLVQHVDAHDNGQKTYQIDETKVEPYLIEDIVKLYNPSPTDEKEVGTHDIRFFEAANFAIFVLRRLKKRELDAVRAEAEFLEAYKHSENSRFAVLDRYLPYRELLDELSELLYVVYPYETGESWMVEAVPRSAGTFETRKPFPESWRGADITELRQLTSVSDVTFCHSAGFIAGAVSKIGALKLLEKTLNAEER